MRTAVQLQTTHGIVIASLDGRGTGAGGDKLMHEIYRSMGTVEVEDQIKAGRWVRQQHNPGQVALGLSMGLLPNTQNRGLLMRREWGTFSTSLTSKETTSHRSRHASWHVRDARAMMRVGIAKP